jgi:transposase-like protein
MPRNTTKKTPSKRRLSAAEWRAVEAIVSGETMKAAAEAAGVDRTTLYRWIRNKPHFQEALEKALTELEATFAPRLTAAANDAIDRVKAGIWMDDSKTAMAFLEKLGLLRPRRSEVSEGSDT